MIVLSCMSSFCSEDHLFDFRDGYWSLCVVANFLKTRFRSSRVESIVALWFAMPFVITRNLSVCYWQWQNIQYLIIENRVDKQRHSLLAPFHDIHMILQFVSICLKYPPFLRDPFHAHICIAALTSWKLKLIYHRRSTLTWRCRFMTLN